MWPMALGWLWPLRADDLGTDDILTTLVLVVVMDWLIRLTKRMSV